MGREGQGAVRRTGYFPRVVLATLVVTVLPGLLAGALQAAGLIHGWLPAAGVAVVLSMLLAAVGSTWWARRPASRDIVFADLMLWGWLRRVRTERRLASARWLLGRGADLDPARKAALLERLSGALESRDLYTHGHSRRVTRHSHRIARQLGLSAADAARIRTAAALHDVGKIETPRGVLNKPGRLTDEEFAVIKRHPVDGAKMVAVLGDDELTAIVRHHHERLDGAGYPDGLVGGSIPLGARIIAVADTFDALTSNRPYRSGCRHKKALDILRAEAGKQLDPDVVAAFLSYYSGRRALPWWSAVAAAPSRLAAWILSGVQGATAGPLGGGATSLGAAFLVGATLAGSPATGEATRPAKADADASPVARAQSGVRSAAPAGRRSRGALAGRAWPTAGNEGRVRTGVPHIAANMPPFRAGPLPRAQDGGSGALGDHASTFVTDPGPSGEPGGGGSAEGDRRLRLPSVNAPRPSLRPDDDDDSGDDGTSPRRRLPEAPKVDLPRVEVPKLDVPKVEVPKVEVPKVDVPRVEVPRVEVPRVEVPKVELPKVELPKVEVKPPPVEVKLPKLDVRVPPIGPP
jgi:putative nucleotidyltransferase with HDIG domain